MPVDPVTRAQFRLALYRIERDWYGLATEIDAEQDKKQRLSSRKSCATPSSPARRSSRRSRIPQQPADGAVDQRELSDRKNGFALKTSALARMESRRIFLSLSACFLSCSASISVASPYQSRSMR